MVAVRGLGPKQKRSSPKLGTVLVSEFYGSKKKIFSSYKKSVSEVLKTWYFPYSALQSAGHWVRRML